MFELPHWPTFVWVVVLVILFFILYHFFVKG